MEPFPRNVKVPSEKEDPQLHEISINSEDRTYLA